MNEIKQGTIDNSELNKALAENSKIVVWSDEPIKLTIGVEGTTMHHSTNWIADGTTEEITGLMLGLLYGIANTRDDAEKILRVVTAGFEGTLKHKFGVAVPSYDLIREEDLS